MKILLVGSGKIGSEYGGGQVYVQNIVEGFLAENQEIEYMSIVFADITEPQRIWTDCKSIKELQLLLPQSWKLNSGLAEKPDITEALAQVINEIKPNIIHAHGWKEYACLAANRCKIPCVVTAHHGGIVCPAGALLNQHDEICKISASYEKCLPCCVRNIPGGKFWFHLLKILLFDFQIRLGKWLHKKKFIHFITPLGTMALSIVNKLEAIKTLAERATCFIAPSEAIKQALIRNGVSENKISIVQHGIPLPKHQPLRHDFGKGPIRFIYVGRLSYVKGAHVMLEAFTAFKKDSYELHIVGGAVTKPERRYMVDLQKKYKSLNVLWHGNKPHEEIPKYIAQCDVMIHPTICLEVYGLNIAESLAVGRPVIATRCGGAEMQIKDRENGFLVTPNDAGVLGQAVKYVIQNPDIIKQMSANSGNVVSINQHIKDLKKIYEKHLLKHNQ